MTSLLLRAALVGAVALGLAGCGGDDPAPAAGLTGHAADVAAASAAETHGTEGHDMTGMDMSGDEGGMDLGGPGSASAAGGEHGFTLNVPLPRPNFVLTDTHGRRYDFGARTRGKATLLYFGYTNCPYQCPTTVAEIRGAMHKLPAKVQRRITVVFVTTDPAHDSPAVLGKWLGQFDSRFVGLTGTLAESKAAQQAAGVSVSAPQPDEKAPAGPASTAHGGGALAYGTDDYAHVTYPAGTSVTDLTHDLPLLTRAHSKH